MAVEYAWCVDRSHGWYMEGSCKTPFGRLHYNFKGLDKKELLEKPAVYNRLKVYPYLTTEGHELADRNGLEYLVRHYFSNVIVLPAAYQMGRVVIGFDNNLTFLAGISC